MATSTRPRVVILGAGFGGLATARSLAGKADVNAEDHTGNTPLHVMAGSWSYGLNPAVTRSLLGAGARKTCRGAHR